MTVRTLTSLLPLSVVTGLAAWCSRGVLDVVAGAEGPVRVALLPPPVTSLAMMLLVLAVSWATLAALGRARRRRARRGGADMAGVSTGPAPPSVLAPLYASGILVLPMLPVVADVCPAVRMLAGPIAPLTWLVLLGLVAVIGRHWVQADAAVAPARPGSQRPRAMVLWLAALLIIGAVSWRVTRTPFIPSGDEPHYLIIAQSLWRDGDLRIQDNHDRGDYREYFDRDLAPHYLTRGKDGEIYSIHPVGLPVVIAPIFALGGYRLVVLVLIAIGAAAAALGWRLARQVSGSEEGAALSWLALTYSVPFVFNSLSVYPEIVAALMVMIAFTTGVPSIAADGRAGGRWWLAGLAVAALPWLSSKYALMAGTLGGVLLLRAWQTRDPAGPRGGRAGRWPKLVALVVPGVVSLAAWLAFFNWIWGRWSPAAPYGALLQTSPRYLVYGGPGLIFDQEYGILVYVPVLLLGAAGAWQMWRHGGVPRRLALESVAVFAALLATVGSFRLWWGDASPGRPVVAAFLLWMLPVAWWVARAGDRLGARLWAWALALAGLGLTWVSVWVQQGGLVASSRDGISRLLQWLGGPWPLSPVAPSFIVHHYAMALGMAACWVGAMAAVTWVVWRWSGVRETARGAGQGVLAFVGIAPAAILVGVGTLIPAVFGSRLQADVVPGAASRSVLLDAFSTTALPVAVRYDPFRVLPAEAALSAVHFLATPGLRRDPQPVPVLLNMRLSLPAGRYRAEFSFAPLPPGDHTVALRVGRVGAAYQVFSLPSTGGTWSTDFELPIDANFVGFEGSRSVAEAVRRIDVRAVSVVDAGWRAPVGQVLSARRYAGGDLFAHDEQSWLEASGAWVAAQRRAAFTFVPGREATPVLRLLSGPRDNRVVLSGPGWQREVGLRAGERVEVVLPGDGSRPIPLSLWPADGFVPAERDPASRDRRFLGVFLEVPGATGEPRP